MAVLHLNTDNFNQTVSSGKVMVDFWAPWCMPCQSLLPVIDELGEELAGKATVAKVNVDDNKSHRLAVPRHEHPDRHLLCGRCGEGTPDRRTAKAEIYRHAE